MNTKPDKVIKSFDHGQNIFRRPSVAALIARIVDLQGQVAQLKADLAARDACIEGWQELAAHLSTCCETN